MPKSKLGGGPPQWEDLASVSVAQGWRRPGTFVQGSRSIYSLQIISSFPWLQLLYANNYTPFFLGQITLVSSILLWPLFDINQSSNLLLSSCFWSHLIFQARNQGVVPDSSFSLTCHPWAGTRLCCLHLVNSISVHPFLPIPVVLTSGHHHLNTALSR